MVGGQGSEYWGGGGGGARGAKPFASKVQNTGWGGGKGERGTKLFVGCKLIGAPPPPSRPKSVPNNFISHIEN